MMLKPSLIVTAALLLITSPGRAQQKKEVVTVDVPPTSYKEVGRAQVSYFRESNTTEVRVELSPYRLNDQSANMFFVFTLEGKKVTEPKNVKVGMAFFASKARLQTLDMFSFELDQEEIKIDDVTVGGIGYDYNAKDFFRDIEGTVSFASFQKLTAAKLLKVRVKDVVFAFNVSDGSALRDMLRTIER